MQETEHDTKERVHRRLQGEDTRAPHERRPRTTSPIGMDPVNDGHRRPEDEILELRWWSEPIGPHDVVVLAGEEGFEPSIS